MRISKIIVALLVSVVAVTAMTGVAVASPESVVPQNGDYTYDINVDGTVVTVVLEIGGFDPDVWSAGQTHTIMATTTNPGNGGTTSDLQYRFIKGTDDSGWIASGATATWTDTADPDTVTFKIRADVTQNPLVGADYDILVHDEWDQGSGDMDEGSATLFATGIPEFATIAIPAIAVLGLFLFFNKRKHKKE